MKRQDRMAQAGLLVVAAVAAAALLGAALTGSGRAPVATAAGGMPDLKVGDVELPPPGGNALEFAVENIGGADAGPFQIEVKNGLGNIVQVIHAAKGLAAGTSATFEHTLPPCGPIDAIVRTIEVDAAGTVAESSESNNGVILNFLYQPPCRQRLAA